ncbi:MULTISPECIES: type I polyketide synthase [unclassified Nostoc]|uniref:type I polyketide synthase n=1 Tax=unclassified Nostoc TaxID=2593658 RepID=UPI002604F171|nr:type I polyketide synthase [Nostoc sp. S13]MDF5735722.1 SDR family NAD(P)-dependent oxidoreductase [Nostoc sp. S13]
MDNPESHDSLKGIAVIGMAGRFPGAKTTDEFWQNLCEGRESISFFTDEELLSEGVDPTLLRNPHYVKAGVGLSDIEMFDAPFFGFTPSEAEVMDPQHRLFLECAWEALENAGYDSETYEELIGVYAGSNLSTYLLNNLISNHDLLKSLSGTIILCGNEKDHIPTRVSYKLNLKGPSLNVSTACSTSLVAVHLACQGLLSYQCDMALAGGIAVRVPQNKGYLHQEDGITSPDGHCRTFDAKAQGTVFGNGMGIVVLKRLEEALANGDCIYAVIKGSAINNDGSLKVGYTAPSVNGQAEVIAEAQALAEFTPETITYIECHGTGTVMGDPIELRALKKVFSAGTNKKRFCAIGSVKTNIGHLDRASGVASLIKTVLALKHRQIPASLHFEQPNPEIDFANSPFYVNTTLSDWKTTGTLRRAGVSSFGFGGTNAHVILEEAPVVEPSGPARPWQFLVLSAKTSTALETATANLAAHLKQHPDLNFADVAYTECVGRRDFDHRRMLVCQDLEDAVKALSSLNPQQVFTYYQKPCNRPVVFMFSGQGAQYVNMGKELYQSERIFKEHFDKCSELLRPHLGLDLHTVLYPGEQQAQQAAEQLLQTAITQPALFVIEYALAQLWMAWGVYPEVMIGHSIGEYVAATVAGVFSLEDALAVVAKRGKLMQQLPTGAMLSVQLPEQQVQPLLLRKLSLAATNASSHCVVSGPTEAVEQLQIQLQEKGVGCRRLHTSHAFHSQMMQPIIEPFTQLLQLVKLNPPKIPFISNVSGTWITKAEATDPNYWARHLRQPVRFHEGIAELLKEPERILLEIGPGRTLSTFALQQRDPQLVALTSLRHPQEQQSDVAFLLNTLGRLWLVGVKVNWSGFYAHERRHRIPLPTYPFERQRYWIEPNQKALPAIARQEPLDKKPDIADWFYVPRWKESMLLELLEKGELTGQKSSWLVFVDGYGIADEIAKRLEQQDHDVITVKVADKFAKLSDSKYAINPQQRDDYDALLQALQQQDWTPSAIAHFWSVTPNDTLPSNRLSEQTQLAHEFFENCQNLGFYSLLFLAQALGRQDITNSLKLIVVTSNIHDVTGEEKLCPEKATVLGPCKVIPKEYPNINCCSIDVVIPSGETPPLKQLIDYLVAEFTADQTEDVVAYRGHHRWVQTFETVRLNERIGGKTKLRQGGVYLITGGLGGIGLVLAEYLAKTVQAKLILIGRKGLPKRSQWEQWLATHDSQDAISCKLQKLLALEELGAQIQVNSADVANFEQMQAAIAQALRQFGEINGVIHAAGIAGGGMVQLKTPDLATSVLAPKVKGTLVLEQVLKNINLDFFVLCSSLSSILGEFGQVDYSAANAFLDVYAHSQASKPDQFTVAINWDSWQEVGMAVETVIPDEIKHLREENLKKGIAPQEGADAFNRILGTGLPQIVVSTQDIQAIIDQNHSYQSLEEGFAFLEEKLATNFFKPTHPRPNLGNDYIAPRNEVEKTVAEIWQQLLGIEQIGIYDNFFELGGHSLLATQVISWLRKEFKVELALHSFFETPTVADQALAVKHRQSSGENNQVNAIERIDRGNAQQKLAKLNQISDQEVESLLNEMLAEKDVAQ